MTILKKKEIELTKVSDELAEKEELIMQLESSKLGDSLEIRRFKDRIDDMESDL